MNGNVRLPPSAMLSMTPPFMQQSPQQPMPNHLGIPQPSSGPNPAMMLNNAPAGLNPQQRYPTLPMQGGPDVRQQRPMQMRPGQPGPPMMGPSGGPVPGGAGAPHMVGMAHSQMGFNPNMMNQPGPGTMVRRVASQPQMGAGGAGGGVVVNNMGMAPQMRQMPQGMAQLRMQAQDQPRMLGNQGPMAPEMPMRPGGANPGMPGRTGSAQLMNSLSQPPSMAPPLGPHPGQFQNSVVQHPPQIPSPRPGSLPHTPSMAMTTPGPSHTPVTVTVNRSQMSPDDPMSLMGYPSTQFPPSQHTPRSLPTSSAGQFSPFVPSSTPPLSLPDMAQPITPGGTVTGNPRSGFHLTPAQQFEHMNPTSSGSFAPFDMAPPSAVVGPRPPSRLNRNPHPHQHQHPHPHTPVPNPLSTPQLPHHSPHSHQHQHPHPHPHPHTHTHPSDLGPGPGPQRPQSQPQRPPSQQAHTHAHAHSHSQPQHTLGTPRTVPALPPGAGVGAPVRPGTGSGIPIPSQPGPPPPMPGPGPGPGPGGPGPGQHMQQIAPRPPPPGVGVGPLPHPHPQQPANAGVGVPASSAPSDTPPSNAAVIPRQPVSVPAVVGQGQGLMRLLQFSASLAAEDKTQKLQLSWWSDLIKEYFTPKAMMKFTLWKDNQRNEAKPFEIGVPILPRFFLVTTQSGVKSMTLSLDGARERIYGPGHSMIECINAIWTYKYTNGYTVTLRGPLTAHIVVTAILPPGSAPSPPASGQSQGPNPNPNPNQPPAPNVVLKFEEFQFDAYTHEKYVSLDSIQGVRSMMISSPPMPGVRNATPMGNGGPLAMTMTRQQQMEEDNKRWEEPRVTIEMASIPGEPVNAFGIPQATMRCLELAESVSSMTDLISFSTEHNLGPLEALNRFATRLREIQPFNPSLPTLPPPMMNGPSNPFAPLQNHNTIPPAPPTTLYSSAPSSITNPSGTLTHPANLVNHAPTPTGTGIGTGSTASPKNAPPSAHNSPQKQHKTIPQQTPGASSSSSSSNTGVGAGTVPAASPAVSSGGTTNTPAMPNASLKRKQGSEAASPTNTVEAQPPLKRQTRRRRTTANNANSGAGG